MKKFKFSLEKVLEYRKQFFENEQNKLKKIHLEILNFEKKIMQANLEYDKHHLEFEKQSVKGLNTNEYENHQQYMWDLLKKIDNLKILLMNVKKKEKLQLNIVIEANKNLLILEKLREKKLEEYNYLVSKNEERSIEEFVVNSKNKAIIFNN